MRVKSSTAPKKPANAVTTSDALAAQTAAFLKKGGKIQEIPRGTSGQQNLSYFKRSNAK